MQQEELTSFGDRLIPAHEKDPAVQAVFSSVARRYDLMNDCMSGGLHRLWKDRMVARLAPAEGEVFFDLASGTGDIIHRIHAALAARGAEAASLIACDRNRAMLEEGRSRALDENLPAPVRWLVGDAEALPAADRSADAVTMAFGLRNVTHIDRALTEIHRILKPCGRFVCLEFSPAVTRLLKPLYDAYSFRIIPPMGRLLTGDEDSYRYLVESIRRFPEPDALAGAMEKAGFHTVRHTPLSGGIVFLHQGWK